MDRPAYCPFCQLELKGSETVGKHAPECPLGDGEKTNEEVWADIHSLVFEAGGTLPPDPDPEDGWHFFAHLLQARAARFARAAGNTERGHILFFAFQLAAEDASRVALALVDGSRTKKKGETKRGN